MNPMCKDCKFFLPVKNEQFKDWGDCHRYPPQFSVSSSVTGSNGDYSTEISSESSFPSTHESYWCGEWQAPAV